MGEAYMGNQHRFRVVGSQDSSHEVHEILDTTYNPNHALSAYYGYRIAKEYLNRKGGMNYVMTGTFHTLNILPSETYRNNGVLAKPWIGDATNPYGHIYSQMFHGELDGNAASATKLKNPRNITVTLVPSTNIAQCSGVKSFDGTANIDIRVGAPYLHLGNGGTVTGATTFSNGITANAGSDGIAVIANGTTVTRAILPVTGAQVDFTNKTVSGGVNIGASNKYYNTVYAGTFSGVNFTGNAASATKFLNGVRITVNINPAHPNGGSQMLWGTEGNGWQYIPSGPGGGSPSGGPGVVINTAATGYLPLTGGTVTGLLNTETVHINPDRTLQSNNISGSGISGDFVKIKRFNANQNIVDSTGVLVDPGNMIDCYIDDLSCDTICAGKGANVSSNSESEKLRIYGNPVEIHDLLPIVLGRDHAGAHDLGAPLGTLKCHEVSCNCMGCNDGSGYIDIQCRIVPHSIETGHISSGSINTHSSSISTGSAEINEQYGKIYSGQIIIRSYGKKSDGTGSNQFWDAIKLNPGTNQGSASLRVNGAASFGSDIRLKSNIYTIQKKTSVAIVSKLIPSTYNMGTPKRQRGLIAQQVRKDLYDIVGNEYFIHRDDTTDQDNIRDEMMFIDYNEFIPDLINTCQYLLAKVDKLEVLFGVKTELEYPELQKEHILDEAYYREHAEEIADM